MHIVAQNDDGLSRTEAKQAATGWSTLIAVAWDIVAEAGGKLTDIYIGEDSIIFGAVGIPERSEAAEKLMHLGAIAAEICTACGREGSLRTRQVPGGKVECRPFCEDCTRTWLGPVA